MHYKLEKYRNKSTRYVCPACGDKNCFARYVCVETGEYVHHSVGRCNHEASCGYHYTPAQFFRDNPWDRENSSSYITRQKPSPPPEPVYIPLNFVTGRFSPDSAFYHWIESMFGADRASRAANIFFLGATNKGKFRTPAVIFWQIDRYMNVHDGKIMWYKADGHREKYMTWVSSRLKTVGLYPEQDTIKCLFGEHQLCEENDKPIVVVESEKSAIVGTCLFPAYIWMATCGCGGLTRDKLRPLRGRKVIVIPDAGEYQKWESILSTSGIDYTITDAIENYPPNTDIVDILIDNIKPINGQDFNINSLLTL